ncbi:hypothetical protein CEQ90_02455 [Lewinellaceae bacterium SD302]|nr:hypothetical protein CEQ90_02455 [Lewinellaceae bacterium SD302]
MSRFLRRTSFCVLLLLTTSVTIFAQFEQPCDNCFVGQVTYDPPIPADGIYPPNTEVTVSLFVDNFQSVSVDWIHGVFIVQLGSGFDSTSIQYPDFVNSCSGAGFWYYEENPWVSCFSGLTLQGGMVFEGNQGIDCGGVPNDSDPGNNWGDGGNICADRIFEWIITTVDEPITDCTEANYGIYIETTADRKSGSWAGGGGGQNQFVQTVCEPQIEVGSLVLIPNGQDGLEVAVEILEGNECQLTYNWTINNNGEIINSTASTVPYIPGAAYQVCIGNDVCFERCFSQGIPFGDLDPGFYVSPNDTLCYGEEFALIATGGDFIYYINPAGDTLAGNDNLLFLTADETHNGVWTAAIFKEGEFVGDYQLQIWVALEIAYTITTVPETPIAGQPVTVTISGAGITDASWANNELGLNFEGLSFTYTFPDSNSLLQFSVSITGQYGCRIVEPYELSFEEPSFNFELNAAKGRTICEGDNLVFNVSGDSIGDSYILFAPSGEEFLSSDGNFVIGANVLDDYNGIWTVEVYGNGVLLGSDIVEIIQLDVPDTDIIITGLDSNGFATAGEVITLIPDPAVSNANYIWIVEGQAFFEEEVDYTFFEVGSYPVLLLSRFSSGCMAVTDTVIKVIPGEVAQVNPGTITTPQSTARLNSPEWQITPNPSDGRFLIRLPDLDVVKFQTLLLTVYDQSGRLVARRRVNEPSQQIDLSDLPAGVYTLSGVLLNPSAGPAETPPTMVSRIIIRN